MTTASAKHVYDTGAKQIQVTRDPVYVHPAMRKGLYLGRQPPTHFVMGIVLTVFNPIIGPLALVFSFLSRRAFNNGDVNYAEKWSQYAFLMCMITLVASVFIYITISFSLNSIGYRGGHSY